MWVRGSDSMEQFFFFHGPYQSILHWWMATRMNLLRNWNNAYLTMFLWTVLCNLIDMLHLNLSHSHLSFLSGWLDLSLYAILHPILRAMNRVGEKLQLVPVIHDRGDGLKLCEWHNHIHFWYVCFGSQQLPLSFFFLLVFPIPLWFPLWFLVSCHHGWVLPLLPE